MDDDKPIVTKFYRVTTEKFDNVIGQYCFLNKANAELYKLYLNLSNKYNYMKYGISTFSSVCIETTEEDSCFSLRVYNMYHCDDEQYMNVLNQTLNFLDDVDIIGLIEDVLEKLDYERKEKEKSALYQYNKLKESNRWIMSSELSKFQKLKDKYNL